MGGRWKGGGGGGEGKETARYMAKSTPARESASVAPVQSTGHQMSPVATRQIHSDSAGRAWPKGWSSRPVLRPGVPATEMHEGRGSTGGRGHGTEYQPRSTFNSE